MTNKPPVFIVRSHLDGWAVVVNTATQHVCHSPHQLELEMLAGHLNSELADILAQFSIPLLTDTRD